MKICQRKFILNRKYIENENYISYVCKEKQLEIRVDCTKLSKKEFVRLDQKCLTSIAHHCKQMCQVDCNICI